MLISILFNWLFGLLVGKYRAKAISKIFLIIDIIGNLSILYIFKYLDFTISNVNYIFNTNFPLRNIVLPIGISFFTFQSLSYVVDIYRQNGTVQKNPLNVGLYISFFPQLIAGPIVRYETVAYEIDNREENLQDFCNGVTRFICGLGKKVLISNNLALVADKSFELINSDVNSLSLCMAWLGAIAYTFQIFFDFSGYSDMAIGLGEMFGFHFLENFNYPYISKSVSEFWKRWHISLQTWFRDYVYIPLGGNRVNKPRFIFNVFTVWLLTGIWHGANWTFIFWGLLYFVLLIFEKITELPKKLGVFGHVYTMFFVITGFVLFRSENITIAVNYLRTMFTLNNNLLIDNKFILYLSEFKLYLIAAALFSTPIKSVIHNKLNCTSTLYKFAYSIWYITIFIICISFIIKGAYNPFIYFNF